MVLPLRLAQPAPQLLGEDKGRLRFAHEHDLVDAGNIDALVEDVHRDDVVDLPRLQPRHGLLAGLDGIAAAERHSRDTASGELTGERACLLHRGGEDQTVDILHPPVLVKHPHHIVHPAGIGNAVVVKRHEHVLVERLAQPNLVGHVVIEQFKDVEPVGAFRGGGEPQQELRLEMVDDLLVRRRTRLVHLVDDDVIEPPPRQPVEVA